MRDTRSGEGRGRMGAARGRQGGYPREAAQRGQPRVSTAYDRAAAQYEYEPAQPKRGRPLPPRAIGLIVLLGAVLTAVVILVSVNAEKNSYFTETVTTGVRINGRDYSGWPVSRLSSSLKNEFGKKIGDIQVKVTYQDQAWTFTGEDLGADENVDEVVSQAALLARVGDLEQRRADAAAIREQGGKDFAVQLSLDPERIKAALREKTAFLATPGQDASVVFNPGLVNFEISGQIEDFNPPQAEIDKMFLVNPERPGKDVDVDMMAQKILDALKQAENVELELMMKDFVPQVTEASLRESFRLVTAYRTKLPSTNRDAQPRIDNIALALSKFNGLILKPGEILSFNETTGERSEKNGYQPAHVIGADKSLIDDFGGGVCQASTTLYNAALQANCDALERNHHSFPSVYAMKGFDAMVNWPGSDLRIQNKNDGNLYVKAYVDKPYVYVMIFGKPLRDGMKITRESELVYKGPEPPVEQRVDKKGEYAEFVYFTDDKPYVLVSGQPEMRYKAYLVIKDKDGNLIERRELYEDHFNEIKRVEILGNAVRPAAEQPAGDQQTGSDTP